MIISTGKEFINLDNFIDFRINVSDRNVGYFIGQDSTGIERKYRIMGCTSKENAEFLTEDIKLSLEENSSFIDISLKEPSEEGTLEDE
jgi:hypothetical protein